MKAKLKAFFGRVSNLYLLSVLIWAVALVYALAHGRPGFIPALDTAMVAYNLWMFSVYRKRERIETGLDRFIKHLEERGKGKSDAGEG